MVTADPAWIALGLVEHMGMTRLRALLDHFNDDVNAILSADEAQLRRVSGIGAVIASAIRAVDVFAITEQIAQWEASGIGCLTFRDAAYPDALRQLLDAPPTLFWRGKLDWLTMPCAAVIGTRYPSAPARTTALKISMKLAREGVCIISGLALGIDAEAHRGALIAEGTTVAVVGNGINHTYPVENELLVRHILRVERGAVLSELHPDAGTTASRLVARNRIIAALCQEVIVVESNDDGGAMHAARRALELGRRVYTLDLPASGNRELLAMGVQRIDADGVGI